LDTAPALEVPALEVKDLAVFRGILRVVDDVSFTVPTSTYVGLLGLNGAGKSSLMAALSGTLPVRGGTILLGGQDITHARSWERSEAGLALVPAGRQLFAGLTVRDNLFVGGHLTRNKVQLRENLASVCDLFPMLRDKLDQRARELSGGQQQMVAIGRALMANPRVLLLDEPSEGLAPVVVDQMFEAISQLRDSRSLSVLLAEQNASAGTLCDSMLLMASGKISVMDAAQQGNLDAVAQAMFAS
jgi:branched-chain amino acid transport system ATP-binding protein